MTKQQKIEARAKRMNMLRKALAIVTKGVCPACGTKLYRNNSMSGWWQCGHVGAEGFQREAGPHCHFSFFYDPTPEEHSELLAEKREPEATVQAYRVTTKIPYHNYVKTFTDLGEMQAWVYHGTGVTLPTTPEAAFLGKHKTPRNEGEVIVEAVRQ